jgi:hypothetical protein
MRLCWAKGNKAIFHKWGEVAQVIPPAIAKGGHSGGEIRYATAIVEYENGQVTEVMASDVVFRDTAETMKKLED